MSSRLTADDIDRALAALEPAPPSAPSAAPPRLLLRVAPAEDIRGRERARDEAFAAHRAHIAATRAELESRPGLHRRLLDAIRSRPTPSALLLGPTGIGKTTAALWLRAGYPGDWCHARELAACERRYPLGEGLAPALERAIATRALYLDDLGTEDLRDVGVLQHLLERRYADCLPTVTTTGLTREQLTERYGAATVRRLTDQHAKRRDGSSWHVLVVDLHRVGGAN